MDGLVTSKADIGRIVSVLEGHAPDGEVYDFDWSIGAINVRLSGQRGPNRTIGFLVWQKDVGIVYVKYVDRKKHFFRKAKAWGLNAHVVKSIEVVVLTKFKVMLRVGQEDQRLVADGVDIVGKDWVWFRAQGFERQILVPENVFKEEEKDV